MKSIFDACLLFLHLAFGRSAHIDLGDTAGQLRQPLFQLFTIVVAGAVLDFATNLIDPSLDVAALAATFDDRRVVLVDDNLLGTTKLWQVNAFQLDPESFEDRLTTGQYCNVFHHRLAAIAISRRLHGGNRERSSQAIDHQVSPTPHHRRLRR